MSRTHKDSPDSRKARAAQSKGRGQDQFARQIRRNPTELRRLSRALIERVMAEDAAAEAEASRDDNNAEGCA